jgi:type I restriction enzyme M protein
MDVKACLTHTGQRVQEWQDAGLEVAALSDLIEPVSSASPGKPDRFIDAEAEEELVTYLRVRYDGYAESGDEVWTSDIGAHVLTRVEKDDIVFSHINTIHGAVAVVPAEHEGHVVTTEYTVCRAKEGVSPLVVWSLVRSPQARADLLLLATGIGRTRIQWDEASKLLLPKPTPELTEVITTALTQADKANRQADKLRADTRQTVDEQLSLDSPIARSIIAAFKPPR